MAKLRRYGLLAPLSFALAALALRLWHLDYDSIWLDEAFTAYHSTLPAATLWFSTVVNKPPLYYHISALFWSPGDGAFTLRLPAALFGAMTVFLAWYLGLALAGLRGAIALALFMLFSSLNIQYSQEARNYTLLTVGWQLVIYAALRLLEAPPQARPPMKLLALLGLGVLVMVQSHPIAGHYLLAAAASYLVALALDGRLRREHWHYPAKAAGLAMLTLLPWLPVLIRLLVKGPRDFAWLEQPSVADAWTDFVLLFGGEPIAVLASLAGLVLYGWRGRRSAGVLLLGLLLLPPLLIWLTGLVKPMYMLRTIMPGHVLAMAGLALLVGAPARLWQAAGAGILVAAWLAWHTYGFVTQPHKEDWRGLTGQWQARAGPGDVLWLCQDYWYYPLHFYLGERMPPAYVARRSQPAPLRAVDITAVRRTRCRKGGCDAYIHDRLPMPAGLVWVIDGGEARTCTTAQVRADLAELTGAEYRLGREWQGRQVYLATLRRAE